MFLRIWRVRLLYENLLWTGQRFPDAHCWQYWQRSDAGHQAVQVLWRMLLVRGCGVLFLQHSGWVSTWKPHRIHPSIKIVLGAALRDQGRKRRACLQHQGPVLRLPRTLLHLRLPLWNIQRGGGGGSPRRQDHQAVERTDQGAVHRRHKLQRHISSRLGSKNESCFTWSNFSYWHHVLWTQWSVKKR